MKAGAIFPRQRRLDVIDHPMPMVTSEGEVLLRVLQVGICGTDRELATFEYGEPPAGSDYFILGHECLAEVVDASTASRFRAGDLVLPTVRRPCDPPCRACAEARYDFCSTLQYRERGVMRAHGFLTEFVVEQERNLNRVPAMLRAVGVLAEPLTVTEKAFDELQAVQSRLPWKLASDEPRVALILGAGPVGLLAAMKFHLEGYRVHVYSRGSEPEKPPLVAAIGATFIDAEQVPVANLTALCGAPVDVIYEAMGAPDAAFEVLQQLGPNGVYLFTGIPRRGHAVPVDTSALLYNLVLKNQAVVGIVNAAPAHFRTALDDLERFHQRFPGVLGRLITKRAPLEAFAHSLREPVGIKTVIEP